MGLASHLMMEFSELHAQELRFLPQITELLETPGQLSSFQQDEIKIATGRYTYLLKEALQSYAEISYQKNPDKKIRLKAQLKFSYDLLEFLTILIRFLHKTPLRWTEIEIQLEVMERLIESKETLIRTTYYTASVQELQAFHNTSIRDRLEASLAKRLEQNDD
jgi:hypothetical protein